MALHVTCPLCREDIDTPVMDEAAGDLSPTLDSTGVDAHIKMHKRCRCRWVADGRITAKECPEHGRP